MTAHPPAASLDRRRTRRFEWCARISVFVVMALELSVLQAQAATRIGPGGLVLVVGALVAHVAANINLVHRTLNDSRAAHPLRRLPRISVALSAAGWVLVTLSWTLTLGPAAIPVSAFALAMSWAAVAVALSWRVMLAGVIGIAAAFTAALAITVPHDASFVSGLGLGSLLAVAAIVAGVWLSGWMLRVYTELDRARSDSARLAVAEERLRISRDLHDVFGRTMATVAVKSELAAELARRGRSDEAAAEIGQVRAIADDAGREVRRVIRGYREADLAVELAGARSLLAAAGIACTVRGTPAGLDARITSVLAWVIREAVTNLIKHSDARQVDIEVSVGEELQMIISNDGVRAGAEVARTDGQGLIGMAERVSAAGGTLQHTQERDRFSLDVRIPIGVGAVAAGERR